MNELPKVWLYTDGGCRPNPGAGAWACVLLYLDDRYKNDDHKRRTEKTAWVPAPTTSNRMELLAVIVGLETVRQPSAVTIFSDSLWVIRSARNPVSRQAHPDLWERFDQAAGRHSVRWKKVTGHSGNRWNERCHDLLTQHFLGSGP